MNILYYLFFVFFTFGLSAEQKDSRSHNVLVTVAPHRFFVEKIAGDTVKVQLMVPAGASAHTFEPTPKETIAASYADIWFRIGESFEDKAIKALKSHNQRLDVVDLRENLDLISDPTHVCMHHKGCMDLHFWLSPKMAKIQAKTMAKALSKMYPEHAALYAERLKSFEKELDEIDVQIHDLLKGLKTRTIMVSHPAYGYFARDYGLSQFSIEFEGKDPTPKLLTKILNEARKENIKTIFIQPQYNSKGALLIAKEIGAKTVSLDPYSENYFESLLTIAKHFADLQSNEN
ncbi:MAG TPA: zinc ABC transporter substrate-binding protein [Parachlamydiaceae bacterium]|nr:zinc ABC transporter substrate-binding protein [Parachlamydiaceae bacterium]